MRWASMTSFSANHHSIARSSIAWATCFEIIIHILTAIALERFVKCDVADILGRDHDGFPPVCGAHGPVIPLPAALRAILRSILVKGYEQTILAALAADGRQLEAPTPRTVKYPRRRRSRGRPSTGWLISHGPRRYILPRGCGRCAAWLPAPRPHAGTAR